jgi:hypothetical protein
MKQAAGVFEPWHVGVLSCKITTPALSMLCLLFYIALELVQCFTRCCCVDCHALWEEFNQQNFLPVPEHGARGFSGGHHLFGG